MNSEEIAQIVDQLLEGDCCECGDLVDMEGDYGWSHVNNNYLCTRCRLDDETNASTVYVMRNGNILRYYIGDHVRMDEYGNDLDSKSLKIDRTWVSTDGWRGHYETTIQDWTEVLTGWTTGGWGDEVSRRKQSFNDWVEALLGGDLICPVPVAVISDPTSNVFSMGVSVLTPQPKEFNEWLGIEAEKLKVALA